MARGTVRLWDRLRAMGRPSVQQLLLVAVLLIQIPLWFGHGGWLDVWRLEHRLAEEEAKVAQQRQLIEELEAEIRDLQTGLSAAEERARYELGLMRPGERFVQIVRPPSGESNASSSSESGGAAVGPTTGPTTGPASASKQGQAGLQPLPSPRQSQ